MASLNEIRAAAAKFFAAEPSAVEVEYALVLPGVTLAVWVGRDGEVFDHPRFAG